MPRIVVALAALIAFPVSFAGPIVAERAAGEAHPIVGTWKWTRSFNACTEVYEFRPDGTLSVLSGSKHTDNTFTISREPDGAGFFEMQLKIVKDHGGVDCGQTHTDDTGKAYTSHILFEPSRRMYISCSESRLEVCFGPLIKVPE